MVSDVARGLIKRSPRYYAGGMDPNDFSRVIEKVEVWDDWVSGVEAYADERRELADKALAENNLVSAGEFFIEAGIYYHFAMLGYFEDIDRKLALKKKSMDIFAMGLDYAAPPIKRLDIPYDGISMAAHLRLPSQGSGPFPLVICLPGVDSTKEEYHAFSEVFLKRGLAVMIFEGPGQGETWFSRVLTEDYEEAASAAIDYVSALADIDADRIAMYGRSMGGHLAPRVAARDSRIKAVVSAGGIYDMAYWDGLAEGVKHNFRHAWGYSTFEEARERALKMTLEGVIAQISVPFLIVHSRKDQSFPAAGAERMKAEATCEAELLIYEEGSHVADNIKYKYQRYVADWILTKLRRS
jgi:dienelactone hydrolase